MWWALDMYRSVLQSEKMKDGGCIYHSLFAHQAWAVQVRSRKLIIAVDYTVITQTLMVVNKALVLGNFSWTARDLNKISTYIKTYGTFYKNKILYFYLHLAQMQGQKLVLSQHTWNSKRHIQYIWYMLRTFKLYKISNWSNVLSSTMQCHHWYEPVVLKYILGA